MFNLRLLFHAGYICFMKNEDTEEDKEILAKH